MPDHETRSEMQAPIRGRVHHAARSGWQWSRQGDRERQGDALTYRQNWSAYNAAQTEEKTRFASLLGELCQGVPQPEQTKGRPRLPLGDMVFASAFKVYSGFSSRRFTSDLREAQSDGHISSAPHFNSVNNYLANPELTPILHDLVMRAAFRSAQSRRTSRSIRPASPQADSFAGTTRSTGGKPTTASGSRFTSCAAFGRTSLRVSKSAIGSRTTRPTSRLSHRRRRATSRWTKCRQTRPTSADRTYLPSSALARRRTFPSRSTR